MLQWKQEAGWSSCHGQCVYNAPRTSSVSLFLCDLLETVERLWLVEFPKKLDCPARPTWSTHGEHVWCFSGIQTGSDLWMCPIPCPTLSRSFRLSTEITRECIAGSLRCSGLAPVAERWQGRKEAARGRFLSQPMSLWVTSGSLWGKLLSNSKSSRFNW